MEKDKRYLLFRIEPYYPLGGMDDLVESFDDIKSLYEYKLINLHEYDEFQIYDRIEGIHVGLSEYDIDSSEIINNQKILIKMHEENIKLNFGLRDTSISFTYPKLLDVKKVFGSFDFSSITKSEWENSKARYYKNRY